MATQKGRVSPLLVNQSVRFRLHAFLHGDVRPLAKIDPEHRIAESNERNNSLSIKITSKLRNIEPAALEDVDVWIAPQQN